MDNPVTHRELEQFRDLMESENKRLQEENERQNHRLKILEENVLEIRSLSAGVNKLAANMENMLKEQERQGKRLETLEGRDGEKWRDTAKNVLSVIIGGILAYIFMRIGLGT